MRFAIIRLIAIKCSLPAHRDTAHSMRSRVTSRCDVQSNLVHKHVTVDRYSMVPSSVTRTQTMRIIFLVSRPHTVCLSPPGVLLQLCIVYNGLRASMDATQRNGCGDSCNDTRRLHDNSVRFFALAACASDRFTRTRHTYLLIYSLA